MKTSMGRGLFHNLFARINWRYASRHFGKAFWIITIGCISCTANASAPALLPVTGADAQIAFLPEQFDFGYLPMGTAGITKTMTVRNDGPNSLVIDHFSTSVGFEVSASSCPFAPEAFPSQGRCTVDVVFSPRFTGNWVGHLTMVTNPENAFALKMTGSAYFGLAELMSRYF